MIVGLIGKIDHFAKECSLFRINGPTEPVPSEKLLVRQSGKMVSSWTILLLGQLFDHSAWRTHRVVTAIDMKYLSGNAIRHIAQ